VDDSSSILSGLCLSVTMPLVKVSSNLKMHYIVPSSSDPNKPYIYPSRPTIVMLHPRFFDSHFFTPQFRDGRLAKAYNIVAIDHHYHGRTEVSLDSRPYDFDLVAKAVLGAMDALKIKEAHVLGNSLGAQIATVMAMQAPNRVQSLILIAQGPPVEDEDNREQFTFLKESCYERADDGSDQLASDVVHALHWIHFGGDPSAQGIVDEWVATTKFKPSNRKLIDKVFSAVLDRQPIDQKEWDKIACPVLIIHGEEDVPAPPAVAQQFYDLLRNADREIHIIDGAPHLLTHTHYRQVNPLIEDFLDKVTGIDSKQAIYLSVPQTLQLFPDCHKAFPKKPTILGMFGIRV